jgi:superfamily I DNA and/or RNA helicase
VPRDPTYFDRWIELLELERGAQRQRYEEEKSQRSPGEQEARGLCLLGLESVQESIGLGGRWLVALERFDRRPLPARWHPGDVVEVQPHQTDAEKPLPGIVSRATRARVQIAFDRAPAAGALNGRLRVDLVPNDVTFGRARLAVERVQTLERGRERRVRELLLGNETPRFDRFIPFESPQPLNAEQLEAAGRAASAEDFFLIHGPPGTGKSAVLAAIASDCAAKGMSILATASSNAAVDHLLELCLDHGLKALRIGHPARVLPRLQEHTLDVLVEKHPDRQLSVELFLEAWELLGYAHRQRVQGRSRERFAKARRSSSEAHRLRDEARALEKKAVQSVLDGAQILCSTLANLEGGLLAERRFDIALVDEATQAIEPLSLWAFLKAPRVILAGDPQQLPPTVISTEAQHRGLGVSLFERLLADHGPSVKSMLREQYRMNEQIMRFPSDQFYGGELRASPWVANHTLSSLLRAGAKLDAPPVVFLDTAGKGFEERVDPASRSFLNDGEADLILGRAEALIGAGLAAADIGIIAPYSAQAFLLRERLSATEVEIDTVDAFQGREKEAILLSLTRSNRDGALGFLLDLRRMNVALTRARRHLFVVGDSATLGNHPFYQRFIGEVQAAGGYRSAWEWNSRG